MNEKLINKIFEEIENREIKEFKLVIKYLNGKIREEFVIKNLNDFEKVLERLKVPGVEVEIY